MRKKYKPIIEEIINHLEYWYELGDVPPEKILDWIAESLKDKGIHIEGYG